MNTKQKTIFLPLTRNALVRSILRSQTRETILARADVRLVVFGPPETPADFWEEFAHPRLIVESYPKIKYGVFRDKIFMFFFRNLLWTTSTKISMCYGSRRDYELNPILYALTAAYFSVFSRIRPWHIFMIWLESALFPDKEADHFFETYHPDLVVTTYQRSKVDVAFNKAARRFGVRSAGFVKSWDNLDPYLFQVYPDYLIVQNEMLRERAMMLHHFPKDKIFITGFGQFDAYMNPGIIEDRETYLKKIGLDPKRKVIFYGSEGPWSPHDDYAVEKLVGWMEDGSLGGKYSLILRPHFTLPDYKRYERFRGNPNVFFDYQHRRVAGFIDVWDSDGYEVKHLANLIAHSEVVVCVRSTLTIEGAIFDKPIINVGYRMYMQKGRDITEKFYEVSWYDYLVKTGNIPVVKSDEEFLGILKESLQGPGTRAEGRKKIRDIFCYGMDGHAGERVGNTILKLLSQTNPHCMKSR